MPSHLVLQVRLRKCITLVVRSERSMSSSKRNHSTGESVTWNSATQWRASSIESTTTLHPIQRRALRTMKAHNINSRMWNQQGLEHRLRHCGSTKLGMYYSITIFYHHMRRIATPPTRPPFFFCPSKSTMHPHSSLPLAILLQYTSPSISSHAYHWRFSRYEYSRT